MISNSEINHGSFFIFKLGNFVVDDFRSEGDDIMAAKAQDQLLSVNSYNARRPTVWQVSISPDGLYVATLQVAKLTVYNFDTQIRSSTSLPLPLTKQPQSRSLTWDSQHRVVIFHPGSASIFVFSLDGAIIFNTLLGNDEKTRSLKPLGIPRHVHFDFGTYGESAHNNAQRLFIVFERFAVVACTYSINETVSGTCSSSCILPSLDSAEVVRTTKSLQNRHTEASFWLDGCSLLVVLLLPAHVATAARVGTRDSANVCIASVHVLALEGQTQTQRWVHLQELSISRGDPFTPLPPGGSHSQAERGLLGWLTGGGRCNKVKVFQPVVSVASSPDERYVALLHGDGYLTLLLRSAANTGVTKGPVLETVVDRHRVQFDPGDFALTSTIKIECTDPTANVACGFRFLSSTLCVAQSIGGDIALLKIIDERNCSEVEVTPRLAYVSPDEDSLPTALGPCAMSANAGFRLSEGMHREMPKEGLSQAGVALLMCVDAWTSQLLTIRLLGPVEAVAARVREGMLESAYGLARRHGLGEVLVHRLRWECLLQKGSISVEQVDTVFAQACAGSGRADCDDLEWVLTQADSFSSEEMNVWSRVLQVALRAAVVAVLAANEHEIEGDGSNNFVEQRQLGILLRQIKNIVDEGTSKTFLTDEAIEAMVPMTKSVTANWVQRGILLSRLMAALNRLADKTLRLEVLSKVQTDDRRRILPTKSEEEASSFDLSGNDHVHIDEQGSTQAGSGGTVIDLGDSALLAADIQAYVSSSGGHGSTAERGSSQSAQRSALARIAISISLEVSVEGSDCRRGSFGWDYKPGHGDKVSAEYLVSASVSPAALLRGLARGGCIDALQSAVYLLVPPDACGLRDLLSLLLEVPDSAVLAVLPIVPVAFENDSWLVIDRRNENGSDFHSESLLCAATAQSGLTLAGAFSDPLVLTGLLLRAGMQVTTPTSVSNIHVHSWVVSRSLCLADLGYTSEAIALLGHLRKVENWRGFNSTIQLSAFDDIAELEVQLKHYHRQVEGGALLSETCGAGFVKWLTSSVSTKIELCLRAACASSGTNCVEMISKYLRPMFEIVDEEEIDQRLNNVYTGRLHRKLGLKVFLERLINLLSASALAPAEIVPHIRTTYSHHARVFKNLCTAVEMEFSTSSVHARLTIDDFLPRDHRLCSSSSSSVHSFNEWERTVADSLIRLVAEQVQIYEQSNRSKSQAANGISISSSLSALKAVVLVAQASKPSIPNSQRCLRSEYPGAGLAPLLRLVAGTCLAIDRTYTEAVAVMWQLIECTPASDKIAAISCTLEERALSSLVDRIQACLGAIDIAFKYSLESCGLTPLTAFLHPDSATGQECVGSASHSRSSSGNSYSLLRRDCRDKLLRGCGALLNTAADDNDNEENSNNKSLSLHRAVILHVCVAFGSAASYDNRSSNNADRDTHLRLERSRWLTFAWDLHELCVLLYAVDCGNTCDRLSLSSKSTIVATPPLTALRWVGHRLLATMLQHHAVDAFRTAVAGLTASAATVDIYQATSNFPGQDISSSYTGNKKTAGDASVSGFGEVLHRLAVTVSDAERLAVAHAKEIFNSCSSLTDRSGDTEAYLAFHRALVSTDYWPKEELGSIMTVGHEMQKERSLAGLVQLIRHLNLDFVPLQLRLSRPADVFRRVVKERPQCMYQTVSPFSVIGEDDSAEDSDDVFGELALTRQLEAMRSLEQTHDYSAYRSSLRESPVPGQSIVDHFDRVYGLSGVDQKDRDERRLEMKVALTLTALGLDDLETAYKLTVDLLLNCDKSASPQSELISIKSQASSVDDAVDAVLAALTSAGATHALSSQQSLRSELMLFLRDDLIALALEHGGHSSTNDDYYRDSARADKLSKWCRGSSNNSVDSQNEKEEWLLTQAREALFSVVASELQVRSSGQASAYRLALPVRSSIDVLRDAISGSDGSLAVATAMEFLVLCVPTNARALLTGVCSELERKREAAYLSQASNRRHQAASSSIVLNIELVEQLTRQGFSRNGAKRSVLATGSTTLERALRWAIEHSLDSDFEHPVAHRVSGALLPAGAGTSSVAGGVESEVGLAKALQKVQLMLREFDELTTKVNGIYFEAETSSTILEYIPQEPHDDGRYATESATEVDQVNITLTASSQIHDPKSHEWRDTAPYETTSKPFTVSLITPQGSVPAVSDRSLLTASAIRGDISGRIGSSGPKLASLKEIDAPIQAPAASSIPFQVEVIAATTGLLNTAQVPEKSEKLSQLTNEEVITSAEFHVVAEPNSTKSTDKTEKQNKSARLVQVQSQAPAQEATGAQQLHQQRRQWVQRLQAVLDVAEDLAHTGVSAGTLAAALSEGLSSRVDQSYGECSSSDLLGGGWEECAELCAALALETDAQGPVVLKQLLKVLPLSFCRYLSVALKQHFSSRCDDNDIDTTAPTEDIEETTESWLWVLRLSACLRVPIKLNSSVAAPVINSAFNSRTAIVRTVVAASKQPDATVPEGVRVRLEGNRLCLEHTAECAALFDSNPYRLLNVLQAMYLLVDGTDGEVLALLKKLAIDILSACAKSPSRVKSSPLFSSFTLLKEIQGNDVLNVIAKQLMEDIALIRRISRVPGSLGVDIRALLSYDGLLPPQNICVNSSSATTRRMAALMALEPFLTVQNITTWVRAVGRVAAVGPSELHYWCARGLVRRSLRETDLHPLASLADDRGSFEPLLSELLACCKLMHPQHLRAFCLCVADVPFESSQYDGLTFAPLESQSGKGIEGNTNPERRRLTDVDSSLILAAIEEMLRRSQSGIGVSQTFDVSEQEELHTFVQSLQELLRSAITQSEDANKRIRRLFMSADSKHLVKLIESEEEPGSPPVSKTIALTSTKAQVVENVVNAGCSGVNTLKSVPKPRIASRTVKARSKVAVKVALDPEDIVDVDVTGSDNFLQEGKVVPVRVVKSAQSYGAQTENDKLVVAVAMREEEALASIETQAQAEEDSSGAVAEAIRQDDTHLAVQFEKKSQAEPDRLAAIAEAKRQEEARLDVELVQQAQSEHDRMVAVIEAKRQEEARHAAIELAQQAQSEQDRLVAVSGAIRQEEARLAAIEFAQQAQSEHDRLAAIAEAKRQEEARLAEIELAQQTQSKHDRLVAVSEAKRQKEARLAAIELAQQAQAQHDRKDTVFEAKPHNEARLALNFENQAQAEHDRLVAVAEAKRQEEARHSTIDLAQEAQSEQDRLVAALEKKRQEETSSKQTSSNLDESGAHCLYSGFVLRPTTDPVSETRNDNPLIPAPAVLTEFKLPPPPPPISATVVSSSPSYVGPIAAAHVRPRAPARPTRTKTKIAVKLQMDDSDNMDMDDI